MNEPKKKVLTFDWLGDQRIDGVKALYLRTVSNVSFGAPSKSRFVVSIERLACGSTAYQS